MIKCHPMTAVLLGMLATFTSAATARTKTIVSSEITYTPAVVVIPEVRTPAGELRTYRTARGVSYWRAGLPVYKGDAVKLNVFVSSGGSDLAETRVRLDNVEIARRTSAPWNSTVQTGDLSDGYHFVEAWARTGGNNPRAATSGLVFFVDPNQAPQANTASPIVEDVPPPANTTLPNIDQGSGGPSVQVTSDNPDVQKALSAGSRVPISAPVVFDVTGPGPQGGFVYALYRNNQQIHRSSVLPIGTKVKLRPNAPKAPGLLPGVLQFVVWGADPSGQLGSPKVIEISVTGASSTQS